LYNIKTINENIDNAKINIVYLLSQAIERRLISERDIASLLSGGLDSSLVVALMRKYLGRSFPVYTIAFKDGSEDLPYAKMVAEHLGLEHHVIEIDYNEALNEIDSTIYTVETWDITTIRASVMQKILGKYIAENSKNRVIFVGENSDELFQGYLYSHFSPSILDGHNDSLRLLSEVHLFDGKRTDRTMAASGLEVRLPFADTQLVDYILSLPHEYTAPKNGVEKSLLRDAFKNETIIIDGIEKPLLPNEILYRQKNAFSDAVSLKSKSWYTVIQEYFNSPLLKIDDNEMNLSMNKPFLYQGEPFTLESRYYLEKFRSYFMRDNIINETKMKIIPHYWMPKWVKSNDPSARTLK
jgi:asparagine synthase (glutamine-hydrolysing)